MDNLKRVIVDFKKLTPEVLKLLVEKYPDGYGDNQIITFRNANGERIEAVDDKIGAYLTVAADLALDQAERLAPPAVAAPWAPPG